MKTKEQIAEMAEREYPIGTKKTMELLKEGFVKGYQLAQKDMKQAKKKICDNCGSNVEMIVLGTMCPECKC